MDELTKKEEKKINTYTHFDVSRHIFTIAEKARKKSSARHLGFRIGYSPISDSLAADLLIFFHLYEMGPKAIFLYLQSCY